MILPMMLCQCQLQLEVHLRNLPALPFKNIKGPLKIRVTPSLANINHRIVSRRTRSSNGVFWNVKLALRGKEGDVDMRSKMLDERFESSNSDLISLLALCIEAVRLRILSLLEQQLTRTRSLIMRSFSWHCFRTTCNWADSASSFFMCSSRLRRKAC